MIHIIFAYWLHRFLTIIQTLTLWARSTAPAWQREPVQHAHENGAEVSERPDIMRTNTSASPEEIKKQQVS